MHPVNIHDRGEYKFQGNDTNNGKASPVEPNLAFMAFSVAAIAALTLAFINSTTASLPIWLYSVHRSVVIVNPAETGT